MIWHSSDITEVLAALKVDPQNGLTSEDAATRLRKIQQKIKQKKTGQSFFNCFLKELQQPVYAIMLALLTVSLLFYLVLGIGSLFATAAMFFLTLLKALLSAFIEHHYSVDIHKAEGTEKSTVRVMRDGKAQNLTSEYLVPGDVILVSEGDYVPADARLLKQTDLHCDEYAVTGETVPVPKNADANPEDITVVSDRHNMIFAGSHVLSGNGVAVVTEILDYTEYAKKQAAEQIDHGTDLPLEQRLSQLGKLINIGLVAAYAVIGILHFTVSLIVGAYSQYKLLSALTEAALLVATVAVAFIPTSLLKITKAAVSRGIRRMKQSGISIYNAKTVHDIAKLDVICADKTGTFTQNKMILSKLYNGERALHLSTDTVDGDFKMLLRIAALCCDGEVKMVKGVSVQSGDATQTAILAASLEHLGLGKYELDNIYPRMAEIPFDPNRKLMTTVNVIDGQKYVIVRGSVEALLPKCTELQDRFLNVAEEMSAENLRVVGVAMKPLSDDIVLNPTADELESGLRMVGLLGLSDLPRLDSLKKVEECRKAGMKVVMITGDHKNAAEVTAEKLHILKISDELLTGNELDEMDDDALCDVIDKYTVFAGVTAAHRARIVKAFKDNGHFVAVTGDNMTNTESLRIADVGYSMGASGSDTAICVSKVVIEDDSFSTVVESVRGCRGIYHNIAKAMRYYLSTVLGLLIMLIIGLPVFGTTMITNSEILLFSTAAIGLMTLGILYERSEREALNIVVDNDAGIFHMNFLLDVVFNAAIYAATALVAYALSSSMRGVSPSTFTFTVLFLLYLVSGYFSRTEYTALKFKTDNHHMLYFLSAAALILIILNIGGFGIFTALPFAAWIYALLTVAVAELLLLAIKKIRSH